MPVVQNDAWIDLLEQDLGQPTVLKILANMGGQRRTIPKTAAGSALAAEIGEAATEWLAKRFGGTNLDFPSASARLRRDKASQLRAAILDAGLTEPKRSANDIAREFGVTTVYVHSLRSKLHSELNPLPLFEHQDPPSSK